MPELLHVYIKETHIQVETILDIVAMGTGLPKEIFSILLVPEHLTTYKRREYIRNLIKKGEMLAVDANAYYYGAEGLSQLNGKIFVFFENPPLLVQTTPDSDVCTGGIRLKRIYPPLEKPKNHHA